MPASDRFTMSTCCAWSSTDMLRCSTPTPPRRAMATAIRASVTVSMAAETSGTRSMMRRVSAAVVSASLGMMAKWAGSRSTSSKVRAGGSNLAASVMSVIGCSVLAMFHPSDSGGSSVRATLRRVPPPPTAGPPGHLLPPSRSGDPLLARDRPQPGQRPVLCDPDRPRRHAESLAGLLGRHAGEHAEHARMQREPRQQGTDPLGLDVGHNGLLGPGTAVGAIGQVLGGDREPCRVPHGVRHFMRGYAEHK